MLIIKAVPSNGSESASVVSSGPPFWQRLPLVPQATGCYQEPAQPLMYGRFATETVLFLACSGRSEDKFFPCPS